MFFNRKNSLRHQNALLKDTLQKQNSAHLILKSKYDNLIIENSSLSHKYMWHVS